MKKTNDNKSLPWWVELLFVQIGLPENLLIGAISYKRKVSTHLFNNIRIYSNNIAIEKHNNLTI